MNERIKEFARTSHLDVYGLGKDRAKWEDTLKKFAELIVKESAKQLDVYKMMKLDSSFYGSMLRKHFGVD